MKNTEYEDIVRFIVRAVLFLIPLIVACIGYEWMMRHTDNDYKYKNRWMSENASKVQIYSLGSSHGYFGIDPSYFDLFTFNGAHVSQDLKYDHFLFKKFIQDMDSLQFLILPVSYNSDISSMEKCKDDDGRLTYYKLYYGCPYKVGLRYHFELFNGIFWENIIRAFNGSLDNRCCSDRGEGTMHMLSDKNPEWKEYGRRRAEAFSMTDPLTQVQLDELYNENYGYVEDMARTCISRNVKVILLTTPVYHTLSENLAPEMLEKTRRFCFDLQTAFDNVVYLDMLNDGRFTEDDFFDVDHLSEKGAKKLSLILNDYITGLAEVP